MTDFDHWLEWYQHNVNAIVDVATARRVYNEYYSCDCQTCVYRKEHGSMPVNMGHGCTVPLQPLDVRQYEENPEAGRVGAC